MEMYNSNIDGKLFNVSIDGLDIIAEEVNPTESYNRRETVRKNIIGGTQHVVRGGYVPRHNTVITHLLIDPEYPDVYDEIFQEWQSKAVEIISRELGGKYNAEVVVKKNHNDSPNYLKIELDITEIPTSESNIPNDVLQVPADEIAVTSTSTDTTTQTTSTVNESVTETSNNNGKGGNITSTL